MAGEDKPYGDEQKITSQIWEYLTLDGVPLASPNLAVLGSLSSPVVFAYVSPNGPTNEDRRRSEIVRVNAAYYALNPTNEKFAALTALTNGIKIGVHDQDGDLVKSFFPAIDDFSTIKRDGDWSKLTGIDSQGTITTGANEQIPIRWTIMRSGSNLWLPPGHSLRFTIQDDLSSLTIGPFTAFVQGRLYRSDT